MNNKLPKFQEGDLVWVAIIPESFWDLMDFHWGGFSATVEAVRPNEFGFACRLRWDDEKAQSLMADQWRPESCLSPRRRASMSTAS